MSILIPDMKVFEYVDSGFIRVAFNDTIDSLYCESIREKTRPKGLDQIFNESKRWTKNLFTLICKSYAARYREELEDLAPFFKRNNTHKVEACQLLKYLQCIEYNIEISTIEKGYSEALEPNIKFQLTDQDREDFRLLVAFINDLKGAIVSQLPEYKTANYAN